MAQGLFKAFAVRGEVGAEVGMGKHHAHGIVSILDGDAVQPGRSFVRVGKQPQAMAQGIFQHGFQASALPHVFHRVRAGGLPFKTANCSTRKRLFMP